MVNWKMWAGLFGAAALFVGGYQFAAALYGADIAALREDYATRAQALEAKYREKERQNAAAIATAWEERDRARSDALRLDADLDRLRDEAASIRSELSRADSAPCKSERTKLAECSLLLTRGAELLERGSRELQEMAADRDMLVKLAK